MLLSHLLTRAQIKGARTVPELDISGISSDSRRVTKGDVFIAHRGTKRDGRDYIAEAVKNGAAAIITDSPLYGNFKVPVFVTENTRLTEALAWREYYGDPSRDIKLIAVTGTNGKTSTSTVLYSILRYSGMRVGLIGTVRTVFDGCELSVDQAELYDIPAAMTTPDPRALYGTVAEMRARGADAIVMELSSHALRQYKADGLDIDIGIFTNLSPEHLDYHGTMDGYFSSKARLFDMCRIGIVNSSDEYGERLLSETKQCRFVSTAPNGSSHADYRADNVKLHGTDGVEYSILHGEKKLPVFFHVPGRFSVDNSLLAAVAADILGVKSAVITDALADFSGVPGRMEIIKTAAPFTVIRDYAHTPRALKELLTAVSAFRRANQRIILLFGCGGDRDKTKRAVMGEIATRYADLTVVTSDNPRSEDPDAIIRMIMEGIDKSKPHIAIRPRREAIAYAMATAKPDDIIILAGKGHENYEIDSSGKHPFDERDAARDAARRLFGKI